ncbi:MAG: carboxypeptidase M32 [Clostridia bacterium]|nr:carboxypeptidase M32 [Clostridia bacterium]
MAYESVKAALERLCELESTIAAYNHAMSVMGVDASTAAPSDSAQGRGRSMEVLSGVVYGLVADPANEELADYLIAHGDELDAPSLRRAQLLRKSCLQMSRIPKEEHVAYAVLLNEADTVWRRAKNENDFASFAPLLEKIVAYNRKFAGYYNPDVPAYDALLNEYEEGLTMQTLDAFFAMLRSELVPLIHAIGEKEQIDDSFLHGEYPIETQRAFSDYLMQVMGIDKTRCTIAETEHPFTAGFNNHDVRITTHYHEDDVASSMFSVIHEGGHALYELGYDDAYNHTALQGGAAMSIHESQSRFYENIIGRSLAFIRLIFPKMQELFPQQLAGVTAEQVYRAVNKAQPSLIRTEADELTYALHIMVRYELEKQLIAGTLEVRDLPQAWNAMMKEYLGVDVPDDARGVLQDTHWSGGMIGYFPSYALGSAYAAQMLDVMEQEIGDTQALVAAGELDKVTAWLKAHIHTHGCLYKPGELFERSCGVFDAKHYTDYLKKKFTALYGL